MHALIARLIDPIRNDLICAPVRLCACAPVRLCACAPVVVSFSAPFPLTELSRNQQTDTVTGSWQTSLTLKSRGTALYAPVIREESEVTLC
jgi:hypothetical protein